MLNFRAEPEFKLVQPLGVGDGRSGQKHDDAGELEEVEFGLMLAARA